MGKKHDKIRIILFLCLIMLPQILYVGIKGRIRTSTDEGRALASMPGILDTPVRKYPSELTGYFNDHIPFRRQMKIGWANLQYMVFDEVEGSVLLGKNDGSKRTAWLFFQPKAGEDTDPILDAQGITRYTDEDMNNMYSQIDASEKAAQAQGFELYYMVAPNKEDVYFTKMPDSIRKMNDVTKTEQFVDFLRNEKGYDKYVYPLSELKEAGREIRTYFRQDTHWNSYGAYIGYKTLMQKMEPEQADFVNKVSVSEAQDHVVDDEMIDFTDSAGEDLQRFTGIRGIFLDADPQVSYHEELSPEENRTPGARSGTAFIESVCEKAPVDETLMVISDSYRLAMASYLEKTFKHCVIMHRGDYEPGMLDQYEPDKVLVLTLERYEPEGPAVLGAESAD